MNENKNNQSHFMTAQEVSDYLRIPLNSVYYLTQKGDIQAVKIGKHWRYVKEDIDSIFPSRRTKMKGEHRQFPRINSDISCQIHLPLHSTIIKTTKIKNLSCGGALLCGDDLTVHNNRPTCDDPLDLHFSLEEEERINRTYHIKTRVVRVEKTGRYLIAVKFRGLRNIERSILAEYIG
ncbi:MAG: helix-turn-helix domain-containing protein [Candidatus Omnitrophica bacterium]|nr:helix-turn-helix domain-containing protein [Candidatus Omnitrophota bacterium]